MIFRRGRFDELVERQLDLFAQDETELLEEARRPMRPGRTPHADETEELYGDYQLVVDAIGEALHEIRETYARRSTRSPRTSTALRSTGRLESASRDWRRFSTTTERSRAPADAQPTTRRAATRRARP